MVVSQDATGLIRLTCPTVQYPVQDTYAMTVLSYIGALGAEIYKGVHGGSGYHSYTYCAGPSGNPFYGYCGADVPAGTEFVTSVVIAYTPFTFDCGDGSGPHDSVLDPDWHPTGAYWGICGYPEIDRDHKMTVYPVQP